MEDFKKGGFAAVLAEVKATLPKGTPIEIWFQEEARVGQRTRSRGAGRDAEPGLWHRKTNGRDRPYLRCDLPDPARAQGLSCPSATPKPWRYTFEISLAIAPGAHAVLLMDQAGWRTTGKLNVPANVTIVTLPATYPELNPVEHI